MKCLMVSPVPTDPVDAGNRARIVNLVESLKAHGAEVHFALLPMESYDSKRTLDRFGTGKFHLVDFHARRESWVRAFARRVGRRIKLSSAYQWCVDDWFDDGVIKQLAALHAEHVFDVVFVEYVFISKAFLAFPDTVLKVLDTHDSFGLRHERYLASGKEPRWFSTSLAQEVIGFERADVVLAIQSGEAADFRARIRAEERTQVVQVGHLVDEVPPVQIPYSRSAIFLGSDNPINTSGLSWFIEQVMPLIRREFDDFVLKVAGGVCKTVSQTDGVQLLGYVEELGEAFSSAAVNVNPVQMGTGINIKILDALAHGAPSVTTRSGARGLEYLEGGALKVVGDFDAPAFAEHVCRLLRDRAELEACCRAAHEAAREWNSMQQASIAAVLNMAEKRERG